MERAVRTALRSNYVNLECKAVGFALLYLGKCCQWTVIMIARRNTRIVRRKATPCCVPGISVYKQKI